MNVDVCIQPKPPSTFDSVLPAVRSRDWLGRTSTKWLILCRLGHNTSTRSLTLCGHPSRWALNLSAVLPFCRTSLPSGDYHRLPLLPLYCGSIVLCGCWQLLCICTMRDSSIISFTTSDLFPPVNPSSTYWRRAWWWAVAAGSNAPGNIWNQTRSTGQVVRHFPNRF